MVLRAWIPAFAGMTVGDGVGHISEARFCQGRLGAAFRNLAHRKKRPR